MHTPESYHPQSKYNGFDNSLSGSVSDSSTISSSIKDPDNSTLSTLLPVLSSTSLTKGSAEVPILSPSSKNSSVSNSSSLVSCSDLSTSPTSSGASSSTPAADHSTSPGGSSSTSPSDPSTTPAGSSSSTPDPPKSKPKRPNFYMTKQRKLLQKKEKKQMVKLKFESAVKDCERGAFQSVRQCALYHKVPYSTLHRILTDINAAGFVGSGRPQTCLNSEEESMIINHVKWGASVGCGVNWEQLQLLVQEILLAIKAANPTRNTGYEDTNQKPNRNFVRRFAERHNLSLRSSAEISKGKH